MDIALAAVVTSGVVGLAGIGAAVFAGRRDRRDAHDLAHETRMHDRRANAYVEVLEIAQRISSAVQSARPLARTDPPRAFPLPDVAEQARQCALMAAFASEEVGARFDAWTNIVQKLLETDRELGLAQRSQARHGTPSIDEPELWKGLLELRPVELAARRRLGDEIAQELTHRPKRGGGKGRT